MINNKHNTTTNNNKHNNNDNNNITLQITLFDSTGKYKPLSTLINVESVEYFKAHSTEIKTQAIQKICNQRYLSGKELAKLGYTTIKVRNYTLYQQIKNKEKVGKKA